MTEDLRFLDLAAKYPMRYKKLPNTVREEYIKLGELDANSLHKKDSEETSHNDEES